LVRTYGGVVSSPTGAIYIATKYAVEALTEALAGEVAGFRAKVTMIEPGAFTTGFQSSMKSASAMPEYAAVRRSSEATFKPEMGDPAATAAILRVVDAAEPPLRLLLGDWLLPMIKPAYKGRLETWNKWAEVSNAAQGALAQGGRSLHQSS
jgi:NAD(P)-dependent dehydrogenase (short-subunit alcohol dehydrogenase family)